MSLNTQVKVLVDALLTATADIGVVSHAITFGPSNVLGDGTGASQANQAFTDTRTINASSSENLDLAGSLTNAFGTTLTFTKIKALVISADTGNTNDVVVGGAASNAWAAPFGDVTDKVNVKPGGILVLTAPDANGLAVVATTGDILKVANSSSGSAVTYNIVIIGVA